MYFHTHTVQLSSAGIDITWDIVPGPMLAHILWQRADQNTDELISDDEAWAWTQTAVESFSAELNGASLPLVLTDVAWPADIPQIFSGDTPIQMQLHADWCLSAVESSTLTLHNAYDPPNSMVWFDVQSADTLVLDIPEQDAGWLQLQFKPVSLAEDAARTNWESGRPTIPWVMESLGLDKLAAPEDTTQPAQSGTAAVLESLLRKRSSSPFFIVTAWGIAMLLGSLHALSPGHGKTIVAAYLVGAQGKVYHAVILGALVTLTHTGTVFALGMVTLTAARYLVNVDILPLLEVISGLLILSLGLGLLCPRLRSWSVYRRRERQRQAQPAIMTRDADSGKTRVRIHESIAEERGPAHSHDPASAVYIPRGPVPENPLAQIRWRSLITLGISGGLVPCPDAIAILLIAVAIHRITFGLSLIVAFSAGLALVLILIGMLIVQGKRLFARLRWFDQIAYSVPVLSALVVLALGAALTLSAAQNLSSASAATPLSRASSSTLDFEWRHTHILYLAPDQDEKDQLFRILAAGGDPEQLTQHENGVWSYSKAPHNTSVLYVTVESMTNSQVWQWTPATNTSTLVLDCPKALCTDLVWAPDSTRILYSRLELGETMNTSNFPSIWWLDLETQETAPLFQDARMPSFNQRWSPDGQYLSYTTGNPQLIQIYDLAADTSQALPTQTGAPVVWSPTGESLLVVDLVQVGELYLQKILRYELVDQTLTTLEQEKPFDDSYPDWSPDGTWISVVRETWDADVPAQGRQLWLMHPDGSAAHPVTQPPGRVSGQPVWSPDGQYLLYSVIPEQVTGTSAVRVLDTETGYFYDVVAPGRRAVWLP